MVRQDFRRIWKQVGKKQMMTGAKGMTSLLDIPGAGLNGKRVTGVERRCG